LANQFSWDETKRVTTIAKHGIDFLDVISIFDGPHLILPARSDVEDRFVAIADWNGIKVAVFFTRRGPAIRLITARRARRHERDLYQNLYAGTDTPDERPH
jgi:uncharacterized DUF497 family protein